MTDHPILFSAPMIRAILAGKKTITRRIVNPRQGLHFLGGRGEEDFPEAWGYAFDGPDHHGYMVLARGRDERHDHGLISIPSPYGEPGDTLWVRETWRPEMRLGTEYAIRYAADGLLLERDAGPEGVTSKLDAACLVLPTRPWRPSIFLPRWASRISLSVVSVRCERLHELTEEDAQAEGVDLATLACIGDEQPILGTTKTKASHPYTLAFAILWDTINGDRASWRSNPWVWRVSFQRTTEAETMGVL